MPQKFFDLVKSSNFCFPLKPSFIWFTTKHGESGESKAVTSIPERKGVFCYAKPTSQRSVGIPEESGKGFSN